VIGRTPLGKAAKRTPAENYRTGIVLPVLPYNGFRQLSLMIRRTETIYVTLDPFLSPRGTVLHRFDEFLAGLDEVDFRALGLQASPVRSSMSLAGASPNSVHRDS